MIHAICDFCGNDTDRHANLMTITPFQNFARYHDDHKPYGSTGPSRSFVICDCCCKERNLPNPYHTYKEFNNTISYEKTIDNTTENDIDDDINIM